MNAWAFSAASCCDAENLWSKNWLTSAFAFRRLVWGSVGLAACFSVEKGIRATELAGTVFGGVKTEVEEEADGDTVSNPGDSACGFGATEEGVEDAALVRRRSRHGFH